jgi:hypothetical protein
MQLCKLPQMESTDVDKCLVPAVGDLVATLPPPSLTSLAIFFAQSNDATLRQHVQGCQQFLTMRILLESAQWEGQSSPEGEPLYSANRDRKVIAAIALLKLFREATFYPAPAEASLSSQGRKPSGILSVPTSPTRSTAGLSAEASATAENPGATPRLPVSRLAAMDFVNEALTPSSLDPISDYLAWRHRQFR